MLAHARWATVTQADSSTNTIKNWMGFLTGLLVLSLSQDECANGIERIMVVKLPLGVVEMVCYIQPWMQPMLPVRLAFSLLMWTCASVFA